MSFQGPNPSSQGECPVHPFPISVLYIDDETFFLDTCKVYLERHGIVVTTAISVREALPLLESGMFDVILSDYQMPEINGIEFLRILQKKKNTIPVIIFSGNGSEELLMEAISNGATDYLQKGGDPKSMFAELARKIQVVSRRCKAEEALKNPELLYKTLFEYSGTAIIMIDENLMITAASAGFKNLTGYEKSEIEGILRWDDFILEEDAGRLTEHLLLISQGSIPPLEQIAFRLVTKDHGVRLISATIAIIPNSRWSIVSLIETRRPFCSGESHNKGTTNPCNSPVCNVLTCNPRK